MGNRKWRHYTYALSQTVPWLLADLWLRQNIYTLDFLELPSPHDPTSWARSAATHTNYDWLLLYRVEFPLLWTEVLADYPVVRSSQLFDANLPVTFLPEQLVYLIVQIPNPELSKTSYSQSEQRDTDSLFYLMLKKMENTKFWDKHDLFIQKVKNVKYQHATLTILDLSHFLWDLTDNLKRATHIQLQLIPSHSQAELTVRVNTAFTTLCLSIC